MAPCRKRLDAGPTGDRLALRREDLPIFRVKLCNGRSVTVVERCDELLNGSLDQTTNFGVASFR